MKNYEILLLLMKTKNNKNVSKVTSLPSTKTHPPILQNEKKNNNNNRLIIIDD